MTRLALQCPHIELEETSKETSMLKEYHYDHLIRWPNGERACVFLTFDFQGGEDVKPDKNGILNYEMWSQGEYGPHHAIYRLLRVLKEENIKATFLTCGATRKIR
jgi:peptidoglycan-N-acetylglucosamine deacetylase